jgi:hypothetical protein
MKEILAGNWFVLLLGILFLAGIIYLAITKQWEKLRGIAYAIMLQAERVFAEGEGKLKFEAVFNKLYYDLIPPWLRVFVPPEIIREKLQEWYDLAKDYLDDGVINSK